MVKKEKINYMKIAWVSLLITLGIEVLFYVIGSSFDMFVVYCFSGANCPTQFDIFVSYLPYTAIVIFLITFVIYSLIKIFKR